MSASTIIGIDLAGPSNAANTALVVAHPTPDGLHLEEARLGQSDTAILALARRFGETDCVFALDAPLSYNDGGGDRPGDQHLRREIIARGLASGSVMPPTMNRMIYLTARGMAIARGVREVAGESARVVEVHPGAAMALRDAPVDAVRGFGKDPEARIKLLAWLSTQRITGLGIELAQTSHQIAAVAAALAGWGWSEGRSAWCWKAAAPLHPFDFAC